MIQDPLTSRYKGMDPTEEFFVDREEFFLDGPITKRVAVLNLDPNTGVLRPGVPFEPPSGGRVLGRYRLQNERDIYAQDFKQVSVFGTILRTMYLYEEADTLGRPLTWAFGAPQLLVVPEAGKWANAFYERESHSLQFYYFPVNEYSSEMIYTSLSRDIVAHETGHAILDGIAPDLYHAITPQSLGLHEAIADITALLMAFSSHNLCETVLRQTGGSISNSTAFSAIAEEFGRALSGEGHGSFYLRSLLNNKTLDPNDASRDAQGKPNLVARNEPHTLSEILTGALYAVMVKLHEMLKTQEATNLNKSPYEVAGRALAIGAARFRRIALRALDYLPPGEITFADYARALIAADQASHPESSKEREWLSEEFVRRHIVTDTSELQTNLATPEVAQLNDALTSLDLRTLAESDWAAYEFANRNRTALGIPPAIPFAVRPRLDVTKMYYRLGGKAKTRECIFRVSWNRQEDNPLGKPFPGKRQITFGATLAIDWESKQVRARLTSDLGDGARVDRDRMLTRLAELGILQLGAQAIGPDGRELRSVVVAEAAGGLMRVRGVARTLHLLREEA
jgi:hypothetical protein